jgi:hypothetical protein
MKKVPIWFRTLSSPACKFAVCGGKRADTFKRR